MFTRMSKVLFSAIFYTVDSTMSIPEKLFRKKDPGRFVVLTYHEIKQEQRKKFQKQLNQVLKVGKPVFADINAPLSDGARYIAVTFDDGFNTFAEYALPELNKRQIPSTLFIPVGYLGKPPGWMTRTEPGKQDRVMTADQLKSLAEHIKIGSHTMTHPRLTELDPEKRNVEIVESKNALEALLGRKITLISFPFNDYNDEVVNSAKSAGYERAFANVPTYPASDSNSFLHGRLDVSPRDWDIEFWLKVRGAYQWLPFAITVKRKILNLLKRSGFKERTENEKTRSGIRYPGR